MVTEPPQLHGHRSDPERISLNDIVYTITAPVSRFLSSTFPQKLVTGDYSEESHPLVSTITWDDFRGGMLKEYAKLPENITRSNFTNLNTTHKSHLFIPYAPFNAELNQIPGDARVNKFVDWDGMLFGLTDSVTVIEMDSLTVTPALTLPANGIDIAGGRSQGVLVIAATSSVGVTWKIGGGSTVTATDTTEKITQVVFWRDLLWGTNDSGELFFANRIPFTDSTLTLDWIKTADNFMTSSGGPKGLLVGPDKALYMVTSDGLHSYDNENERFDHVFKLPTNKFGGDGFDVWGESIYYASDLEVWKFTPSTVSGGFNLAESIGLDADDGLPNNRFGSINALTHSNRALYAQVEGADTTKLSAVYEWDRIGWGTIATASAATVTIGDGLYVGDKAFLGNRAVFTHKLVPGWVSPASSGWPDGYPLRARQVSPTQTDTNHSFGFSTAEKSSDYSLITPWIVPDGDQVWNALSISVVHSWLNPFNAVITDSEIIEISYGKDFESSFTLAQTLKGVTDSDGTTSIPLPAGAESFKEGIPFNAFRLKVSMSTTGPTQSDIAANISGDVNRLSLHFRKNLDPLWGYRVVIDTSKEYQSRDQKRVQEDLIALFSEKTLLNFSYHDAQGDEQVVRVAPIGLESQEGTGPHYEGVYVLTLSEVQ